MIGVRLKNPYSAVQMPMTGGVQDIEILDHLRRYQSERLHSLSHISKSYCLIGEMFSVS